MPANKVPAERMTWRDLLVYLKTLESDTRLFPTGDHRLDRPVITLDVSTMEYNPCEIMEVDDNANPMLDRGTLFLMLVDWNGDIEREPPTTVDAPDLNIWDD